MSCSEREPRFVRYELTKTRCGVYETVRSSSQHSLEFRWMEKRELILVAQSRCDCGSQLGTFRQRQRVAVLNTNRSRECTREKAKKRWKTTGCSKSSWWRYIVFFQVFLQLFKLFTMGFFYGSAHKKLLTNNFFKKPFFCFQLIKWLEKKDDDYKKHFRFV